MASADVGKLSITLVFDNKGYDASLKDAEKSTKSFGDTAKEAIVSSIAVKAFGAVTDAVKGFATSMVQVGMSFEKSMSKVAAISGATGDELEALTAKAQEMGENTVWSASDAADAMSYMAMAGWKTEDMLDGIAGVMDLATAAGADLATTSDIVTDALTAFGLSAKDSGRLADVMAAASSNANTNVELMGETFKYAASVAGAMGYSIEDTAVAIGLMANAGIKGTQAGTSLRSIMQRLATDTSDARTEMEKLGVQVLNEDGSMRDLNSVMKDMRKAFSNLSQEEQINYAKTVAGQEAMSGLLAIVNASDDDFNKLTSAVANSNGAAAEMAAIMGDNLAGNVASLNSKFEALQIEIYNKVAPALNVVVDVLKWAVDNADWLIPVVVGLTAAFAAYELVANAGAIATGVMTAAQTALNIAMNLNPVGLIVAGIVALIAILVTLWNNCEGFRNFIMGVIETIGSAIGAVGEFIGGVFSKIGEIATTIFSAIWDFISPIVDLLVQAFQNWWAVVSGIFGFLWDTVSSVFGLIWNNISGTVGMIAKIFSGLWDGLKSGLSAIGSFFKSIFDAVWGVVSGVVNAIKNAFQGAWNFITGLFGQVASFFGNIFGNAWNAVKNIFSTGGKIFSGIVDGIANAFKNIVNAIINGINKVVAVPFNAINGFLNILRGIDILGFKPFDWVGTISVPQIPTFATGGIVDGDSYSGDRNLARVNSGEMIITRSQQAALWEMIETGNYGYDDEGGVTNSVDNSSIEINNNYQINSTLDAEEIGDLVLESIRRAVI